MQNSAAPKPTPYTRAPVPESADPHDGLYNILFVAHPQRTVSLLRSHAAALCKAAEGRGPKQAKLYLALRRPGSFSPRMGGFL